MRLGLDIGTNSIGWWLFALDAQGSPTQTIDAGVRIFSDGRDPKSKASLAVGCIRQDFHRFGQGRWST